MIHSRKNVGKPRCLREFRLSMRHTSPKEAVAPDSILRKGIAPGPSATGARTNATETNKSKESAERGRPGYLETKGVEESNGFRTENKKRKAKTLFVSAPPSMGRKRDETDPDPHQIKCWFFPLVS